MRVILLISSLGFGGTQRQLVELAKGLKTRKFDVSVAVYYSGGALADELRQAGVPLFCAEKRGRWDIPGFFFKLIKHFKSEKPDLIYSFLPGPNVVLSFISLFIPSTGLVWGIRASNMLLRNYPLMERAVTKLAPFFARKVDLIISNSTAGAKHCIARGYPEQKVKIVQNGIDTAYFAPDPKGAKAFRSELSLTSNERLVGLIGRIDPMKDHETCLRAASILRDDNLYFVCIGSGPSSLFCRLKTLTAKLNLDKRVFWAGERSVMPAVYSACDLTISCSMYGEGFSNAIAESMACQTPCVVTDVGDSAEIVGDCGRVVRPGDPEELAEGIRSLLAECNLSGQRARERICQNYSLEKMIASTEELLQSTLPG